MLMKFKAARPGRRLAAFTLVLPLLFSTLSGLGQSSEALINKLVEKGILTSQEAGQLREEAKKESAAPRNKIVISESVTSLKLSGDFRVRYDGVFQDDQNYGPLPPPLPNGYATQDRTRFRYRLRYGATLALRDEFEFGLRLGSGDLNSATPSLGGNIFSGNTTFNNDSSRKFIFIDLAYAKWAPKPWVELQVGKMLPGFWLTDMLLDPDYSPEGAQERFTVDLAPQHKLNFTAGQWVIAENFNASGAGNNNDVYLFLNQAEWNATWSKQFSTRLAVASMNFKNQRDLSPAIEIFINQNGTPAVGAGSHNFNPVIGRGEATFALDSFPAFHGTFPLTVGGEFVINPAVTDANKAYNLGFQIGSAKSKGNWQVNYNYKNIETASTWRGLNDDDFGFNARGGTDVRGHQVAVSYHAWDPFFLNLRYYLTEQIGNRAGTKAEQGRLMVDLFWVF